MKCPKKLDTFEAFLWIKGSNSVSARAVNSSVNYDRSEGLFMGGKKIRSKEHTVQRWFNCFISHSSLQLHLYKER